MRVIQDKPGTNTHAAQEYLDRILKEERAHEQGIDDVPHLASYMSKVGFKNVSVDVFSSDRVAGTRNAFNDSILGAFHGITKMFIKSDGKASFWTSDAAAKLYEEAVEELADAKAYYRAEINVVCGQKPQ